MPGLRLATDAAAVPIDMLDPMTAVFRAAHVAALGRRQLSRALLPPMTWRFRDHRLKGAGPSEAGGRPESW